MRCPNCQQKMEVMSDVYWTMADWDSEEPGGYYEIHTCQRCKISAELKGRPGCSYYVWTVPKSLQPTDKQYRAGKFIYNVLHITPPPPTKNSYWRFIHDNLQDAIDTHDANFTEWCEDNADWLPEYF